MAVVAVVSQAIVVVVVAAAVVALSIKLLQAPRWGFCVVGACREGAMGFLCRDRDLEGGGSGIGGMCWFFIVAKSSPVTDILVSTQFCERGGEGLADCLSFSIVEKSVWLKKQ